ncbi:MAG TPA: VWA domain-containing protein [Acidimicrobiales bacterium]|nr:VWA domain-containing protein [Acidimicrobiales bacterium]
MAEDVAPLGLLASALAGRALAVGAAGPGEPAWTDGATVFVDPGAAPADRLRAVAVQASLVAGGSLAPDVVRPLARRPALARRYLAVEGHRALAANGDLLPPGLRPLVDHVIAALAADPPGSLAVARGPGALPDPPAAFGTLRPRALPAAADAEQAAATAAAAAGRLPDVDDDDADPDEDVGSVLTSPVGGRGALGRLLARLLRPARGPGGTGPVGAGAPARVGRSRPAGGAAAARGAPEGLGRAAAALGPRDRVYPEWDVHRRRYRPAWCTVHERTAPAGDGPAPALPGGAGLRRPLARLGTGLDRTHRRPQGDDVDLDAAVEARVAALAGVPADEAVYVESLRRRRDLAVLVLLDVSGSAGEPGPAGRTVHEHQRAAAGALTAALHDLGDRVALYAFHSQGRTAVHVTRVKGFDDRLDGRAARRLGALVPGAYTRLGAAIRHGAHVLDERGGTPRRLLLVLSDGLAYDHGYGGRYGEADARRALAEARRRGIGCLCLSVGAGTEPVALRRVFGPAAHATVPTPDRLPALIGPLVGVALGDRRAP